MVFPFSFISLQSIMEGSVSKSQSQALMWDCFFGGRGIFFFGSLITKYQEIGEKLGGV